MTRYKNFITNKLESIGFVVLQELANEFSYIKHINKDTVKNNHPIVIKIFPDSIEYLERVTITFSNGGDRLLVTIEGYEQLCYFFENIETLLNSLSDFREPVIFEKTIKTNDDFILIGVGDKPYIYSFNYGFITFNEQSQLCKGNVY